MHWHIWNVTNVISNVASIIQVSSSGHWVTKRAMVRTLKLHTIGLRKKILVDWYNMSNPEEQARQIFIVLCTSDTTVQKNTARTNNIRNHSFNASTLMLWEIRKVASRNIGISSASTRNTKADSFGTSLTNLYAGLARTER